MFSEEQIELKSKVDELNDNVYSLKNDLLDLILQFQLYKQQHN